MKLLNWAAAATVLTMSTGAASAGTIFADTVIDVNQGTCVSSGTGGSVNANGCLDDRSTAANALGATDGSFFSLGEGGSITLGFGGATFAGGSANVYEVTFNRDIGHDEAVDLYSVLDGVSTYVARLTNASALSTIATIAGSFDAIKLVDATVAEFGALGVGTSSFDGFDVDSVGVNAVPVPAAGFLLLGGLAGFGALRRKKA